MNQSHFHGGRGGSSRKGGKGRRGFGSLFCSGLRFGGASSSTAAAAAAAPPSSLSLDYYPYPPSCSPSVAARPAAPAAAAATAAAPPAAAPSYIPVDAHAWRYIERTLFQPLARGSSSQAPLGALVGAIQDDPGLRACYGQAAIEALLRPVANPTGFLAPSASGSTFAGGKALVWVGMDDFRRRCSNGSGTSSPGKRKRPAPSSSSSVIWQRLDMAREDLAQLLKRVSADYSREMEEGEAAAAAAAAEEAAAVAAAGARADGVLAAFGGKGDELTRAIAEMEGVLEGHAAARREVAMARAEREAALEARMAFDPLEALARERLAPLTEVEQEEALRILRQGGDMDTVVSAFNVQMLRQHLRTLRPRTWLNDEVINFWMCLLDERDKALVAEAAARGETRRRCWFFNSFFLAKLLKDDPPYRYQNVRRWSRRAGDLFAYDKVFFPVNIDNMHWCLAIVHMQEKRVQYLDSMAGAGHMYLEGLKRYLADEHQDKKKAPLDMDDWELVPSSPRVTPQQGNGSDCGCFASAFAYLISEGIPFTHVSQKDMERFRERMILSIARVRLSW